MEAKVNTSCNTRALAQVIVLTLLLLGCLYRAPGYLSGMLFRVLIHAVSLVPILLSFLTYSVEKELQVAERRKMGMDKFLSHAPLPNGRV